MSWLLALILGLPLVQPATTQGSISTQPLDQNDLNSQGIINFQQTHPISHPSSWTEEKVGNSLYRDLLLPNWPNFAINAGLGEGSGLQQSIKVIMPSSGLLEMDTLTSNEAEKLDLEDIEGSTPPVPQRLTQRIVNDDDDRDVILANANTDLYQATSTMPVQLTTHTHTTYTNNNKRMNKDQPLLTTNKPIRENNTTINSTLVNMHVQRFITNDKLDHRTSVKDLPMNNKKDVKSFQETRYASTTQTLSSITKPEMLENNGILVMQSKSFDNPTMKEERYITNHAPTATPPLQTGQWRGKNTTSDLQIPTELPLTNPSVMQSKTNTDKPEKQDVKPKWFEGWFEPLTNSDLSGTVVSCISGPCVVSTNSNITRLQWEDLKRTLTFAWDLHVYGSAILFSLVGVIAIFGIIGGTHMLHPLTFIFANILLLLAGLFRLVLFIIDPYGTRNIMSLPTLIAFYNLPVTLLLWAQVILALFSLRQERLSLQTSPQQLLLTGGLAAVHCTSILMADLLSNTLSPALPLMLQTFTICWGLPLCLGIFFQSLKQLRPSQSTVLPRWSASQRVVNNVRRVLLLCGLLGVLSCALQIYGFLWLYGLLGDWQRFGWGWWVVQLCARLLEQAWSFSLLLLGSRVFWRPRRTHRRAELRNETTRTAQKGNEMSQVYRALKRLPMGPWGKPDRNWAELLPNNWKGQQQSRGNVSHLTNNNEETPAASVTTVHDSTGIIGEGSQYISSNDCHGTPLWTSGVEWQEHECYLSLIEFDHCPPSHVNLSMNSALHHAHLLGVGTIFAPSPPSWDQYEGPFNSNITSPIPNNRAYRWTLDPCSSPVPTHHFGSAVQQTQVSVIKPLESLTPETLRRVWERDTAIPGITSNDDWDNIASGDDVTSL